jgi:hypothetical protein
MERSVRVWRRQSYWTTAILASVAKQIKSGSVVELDGKSIPVRRTSSQRLRTLAFTMAGRQYQAIEQNTEKPSRPADGGKWPETVIRSCSSRIQNQQVCGRYCRWKGQGVRASPVA